MLSTRRKTSDSVRIVTERVLKDLLERHVELFNAAVSSGNYDRFLATFAEHAVMRFEDFPLGPFVGLGEIAEAYANQPPSDTMALIDMEVVGADAVTAVFDGVETPPAYVVSVGQGEPVVEKVTVKDGVLKARGSNFDPTVEVTVDGLRFVQPATVKREGTRVSQSGRLENGQSLAKFLKQHRNTALVAFRNANGAATATIYGPLTLGH